MDRDDLLQLPRAPARCCGIVDPVVGTGPMTLLLLSLCTAFGQDPPILPPIDLNSADRLSVSPVVVVRRFSFDGNTAFSDQVLAKLVAHHLDKVLTSDDLEQIRREISAFYIDHGYINSGAVLRDQTIADGTVRYQIIEGRLTDILVHGQNRVRPGLIRQRIALAAAAPLNIRELKDGLEILRQDPNLRRINAELKPAAAPGESYLDVRIEEREPFSASLRLSNDRAPSVGAEQLQLLLAHTNLSGIGDTLSVNYGLTRNGFDDLEFGGIDDISLRYTLPITPDQTTINLSYARSSSTVIELPFEDLDILSESESIGLTLRRFWHRTGSSELALGLGLEYRQSQTYLESDPFSFAPGAEDGRSAVTVVRFRQEYLARSRQRAVSARSTFSFGIDAFGATQHSRQLPDGRFTAWLGQIQWLQRLAQSQHQLLLRLNTQLTPNSLMALEQFSLAGMHTVRGYREHQLVRDNAVVASAELRIGLLADAAGRNVLQLAPFFDAGYGFNDADGPPEQSITSAGIGLLAHPTDRISMELYWGYPMRNFTVTDHNLQDEGIHFNVAMRLVEF